MFILSYIHCIRTTVSSFWVEISIAIYTCCFKTPVRTAGTHSILVKDIHFIRQQNSIFESLFEIYIFFSQSIAGLGLSFERKIGILYYAGCTDQHIFQAFLLKQFCSLHKIGTCIYFCGFKVDGGMRACRFGQGFYHINYIIKYLTPIRSKHIYILRIKNCWVLFQKHNALQLRERRSPFEISFIELYIFR